MLRLARMQYLASLLTRLSLIRPHRLTERTSVPRLDAWSLPLLGTCGQVISAVESEPAAFLALPSPAQGM